MAHYRKIDTRIWNDEKFRSLSDDGQLCFFFQLTHPHMTAIGAMRATLPGLAAEKGWLPERFEEAFEEASAKGMAKHDPKACLVWIPKFIRYNAPESPNVLKAWASAVELLPECDLTRQAIQSVKDFAQTLTPSFIEALPKVFREACRQPSLNQEQEQEQEESVGAEQRTPSVLVSGVLAPVAMIPLNDGSEYAVTSRDVDEWRLVYPAVDVLHHLRRMREWCRSNPKRRKTRNGARKFITEWLGKEQDRGRTTTAAPKRGEFEDVT